MELRERYDPEDIETLLSERGFDELLEEERAYVLRHLSDRDEYEAMRALLMHMRTDAELRDDGPADLSVRTAVLAAFKEQQRPIWSIWLNSVAAALWPKEAAAMWRPALALATVALLVGGVWWTLRTPGPVAGTELAELRENDANVPLPALEPPVAVEPARAEQRTQELMDMEQEQANSSRASNGVAGWTAPVEDIPDEEAPPPPTTLAAAKEVALDNVVMSEAVAEKKKAEVATGSTATRSTMDEMQVQQGHVVTAEEFARNLSVTNADIDGRARERSAKALADTYNTPGRNLAADEVLLSLVNTGW